MSRIIQRHLTSESFPCRSKLQLSALLRDDYDHSRAFIEYLPDLVHKFSILSRSDVEQRSAPGIQSQRVHDERNFREFSYLPEDQWIRRSTDQPVNGFNALLRITAK